MNETNSNTAAFWREDHTRLLIGTDNAELFFRVKTVKEIDTEITIKKTGNG